jgi:hypothetical protein
VAAAYLDMDSLKNTDYLKLALDKSGKEWDKRDSLEYFAHRVSYHYRNTFDSTGEQHTTYFLTGREKTAFSAIKKITIHEMIDHTYLYGISTNLDLKDTSWIKTRPVKTFSIGGYLCSHQVYVHQNSPKVTAILKRLEAKRAEIEKMDTDSDDPDKWDKTDEEVWMIIRELEGLKVVVITECTC